MNFKVIAAAFTAASATGILLWLMAPSPKMSRVDLEEKLALEERSTQVAQEWVPLLTAIDPQFQADEETVSDGYNLSKVHCTVCHLRPSADALPKNTWLEVFPHLFPALGREVQPGQVLPSAALREYRIPAGDAAKIVFSYLTRAPHESLPQENRPRMSSQPAPFKVKLKGMAVAERPEAFLLAKVLKSGTQIVLLNVVDNTLVVLNSQDGTSHTVPISGVATGFLERDDGFYLTLIGPDAAPNNDALGALVRLPPDALRQGVVSQETVILSKLRRPVHTTVADLNGDQRDDFLVEEFGLSDGGLHWYKRMPDETYERNVLIDQGGAVSAHVLDMNRDGLLDVLGLVSQNIESVLLFSAKKAGVFKAPQSLAQNQPGFGSMQILWNDMNGDSFEDIILMNGDNFDYPSRPLKNYHGIHILLNDGENRFTETYFYPFHGVYQAVARDFDQDGDTDIAAVAMFPDTKRQPLETFVYLENKANTMVFEPHSLPATARASWAVIDAGDIDHDLDDDIIIGAINLPLYDKNGFDAFGMGERYSYLVLENTTRDPEPSK